MKKKNCIIRFILLVTRTALLFEIDTELARFMRGLVATIVEQAV